MKKFINPQIRIFEFSKEEILQASSGQIGEYPGGAGNEGGGDVLSVNPVVNIDTITR